MTGGMIVGQRASRFRLTRFEEMFSVGRFPSFNSLKKRYNRVVLGKEVLSRRTRHGRLYIPAMCDSRGDSRKNGGA